MAVNLYVGNRNPSLADTLRIAGQVVDLTSATVTFKMRPVNSSTLKVNTAATIVSAAGGQVRYDWAAADVDTEGEYLAWFVVTETGKDQDAPEFLVIIDSHSPGTGTTQGEIAYQTKQFLPVTWDRLRQDARYGDRMLQGRINYVKYRLFATVVDAVAEATVYNPLVIDYVAKESALQIIPAGIEYWMTQAETISTNGTSETAGYPDRITALEKQQMWLLGEVRKLREELPGQFTVRRRATATPGVSNTNDNLITPDPSEFGAANDEGIPKNLPWAF